MDHSGDHRVTFTQLSGNLTYDSTSEWHSIDLLEFKVKGEGKKDPSVVDSIVTWKSSDEAKEGGHRQMGEKERVSEVERERERRMD